MLGIGKVLEMNYQDIIRNFVQRTRINLDYIENALANSDEVYEVTQLVNSLLGLLVFPEQYYFHQIPQIPLEELVTKGWPKIKVVGDFQPAIDLREQMRYLRNSIAHFNIRFLHDAKDVISGLHIWNTNPHIKGHPKTWEAEIPLEDLRLLVNKFADLILAEIKE